MRQTDIPRHIKIGLTVLGIGFAITLGFFVDVIGRIQSVVDQDTEENPFTAPTQPLYTESDPPMTVKLFFPSGNNVLSSEEQTIFKSAEITNRAKQIVQRLLDGPRSSKLFPSIPPDTRIQELFVSDKRIAFIDFSDTIAANHAGGVLNEQATIYSIVNSLTYNLPEIQHVKILIGGIEKETLAGHCLLLLPLEMDLSITDMTPGAEAAAAPGGV
jgi:germination protein M